MALCACRRCDRRPSHVACASYDGCRRMCPQTTPRAAVAGRLTAGGVAWQMPVIGPASAARLMASRPCAYLPPIAATSEPHLWPGFSQLCLVCRVAVAPCCGPHSDVTSNNLVGTVPSGMFPGLSALTTFEVSQNAQLTGSLPADIGNATTLVTMCVPWRRVHTCACILAPGCLCVCLPAASESSHPLLAYCYARPCTAAHPVSAPQQRTQLRPDGHAAAVPGQPGSTGRAVRRSGTRWAAYPASHVLPCITRVCPAVANAASAAPCDPPPLLAARCSATA